MKIVFFLIIISSFIFSNNVTILETKLMICENNEKQYLYFIGILSTVITFMSGFIFYQYKEQQSLIKENSNHKADIKYAEEIAENKVDIKIEKKLEKLLENINKDNK